MIRVRASEFARNFGRYREAALTEPVAVTNHDRVTGVLVSPQAFEEYERLKRHATQAFWAHELSNETIKALAGAEMDSRHDHLDSLMEDD